MKLLKSFSARFDALRSSDWRERDVAEREIRNLQAATRAYRTNCTGDVVTGDEILFIDRVWGRIAINRFGRMANVVSAYELIQATVLKDSYGQAKQQHTFTLLLSDGTRRHVKGRNLYAVGVWRKNWTDDQARNNARNEKHRRGEKARTQRRERRQDAHY